MALKKFLESFVGTTGLVTIQMQVVNFSTLEEQDTSILWFREKFIDRIAAFIYPMTTRSTERILTKFLLKDEAKELLNEII